MVAVDTGQDKAAQVTLLPFIDAHLGTDGTVLIAYGTASLISFETIVSWAVISTTDCKIKVETD